MRTAIYLKLKILSPDFVSKSLLAEPADSSAGFAEVTFH